MFSKRASIALACAYFTIDAYRSFALLTIQPVRFACIDATIVILLVANVAFWSQMTVALCMAILLSPHHFLCIVYFLILVVVILAKVQSISGSSIVFVWA